MNRSIKRRGLNEAQAARYLGVARSTLRQARVLGTIDGKFPSPPFVRAGRRIIYLIDDLDGWLEQHKVDATKGGEA